MITREEIRSIPELHKSILRDQERLLFLQEKAMTIPSPLSGREKVQTSPSGNVNKYTDAAVDLSKEIQEKEMELLDLQSRAGEFISTVEDRLAKKVLTLRYLKCYLWDEVAHIAGYDLRWVQRKEQREVDKLTVAGHVDRVI